MFIQQMQSGTNVGGIAGKATNSITNVIVSSNVTIKGSSYSGGITGETTGSITNATVSNNVIISSTGVTVKKLSSIYVGGIAGKTSNSITNVKVTGSNIGNGNVTMEVSSSSIFEKRCNNYYVGGIAGYTNNIVASNDELVSNDSTIKGGKILVNRKHRYRWSNIYWRNNRL